MFFKKVSTATLALTAILTLTLGANLAYSQTVLLEENFDNLALGSSLQEGVAQDNVWTNQPPDDWSIVNDLPDGMPEWNGWAFADGAWWTETAGDQERSKFTQGDGKGSQIVAIADPDEWDDLGSPGDVGTFDSWLSTPAINIAGAAADSLTLTYDSSWRPEDTQTAELTVSFDGDDPIVIIRMESVGTNTLYTEPENNVEETFADLEQVNETVEINIDNPASAKTVVITWAMIIATNDWWWAIDNISLATTSSLTPVEPEGKLATIWGAIKR